MHYLTGLPLLLSHSFIEVSRYVTTFKFSWVLLEWNNNDGINMVLVILKG